MTEPSPPVSSRKSPPEPGADLPDGARQVRLRRAPRYRAFVVTGVLTGVLAGLLVAFAVELPTDAEEFSRGTVVRYFVAVLGLLGGVVGAGFAVLVERRR